MNITLILGSIRPERQSIKPALYLQKKLEAAGHQITFIDLKELNLPVFNDTPEQTESTSAKTLVQSVVEADGIILVTPEYNHTFGSATKNALDFLRHREFMHKPLGLVAVSNGAIGGARAIVALRGTVPTIGAVILPTAVQVPLVEEAFLDSKSCSNPRIDEQMNSLVKEMSAYAPALQEVRKQLKG